MKKFVFVLLALGAIGYYWHQAKQKTNVDSDHPAVITNPVYAEFRVGLEVGGREYSQIYLIKTADQKDCERGQKEFDKTFGVSAAQSGQGWKIQNSECKREIESRYTRLFDNVPTHVSYLSVARGAQKEREMRVISWGVTVEESNLLCEHLSQRLRNQWEGAITCIRAKS
jgi:putative protein kinase ArgK-like GTPase of G3E family